MHNNTSPISLGTIEVGRVTPWTGLDKVCGTDTFNFSQ